MGLHEDLLHAARVRMIRNIGTTDRLIRQLYIRAAKNIEAQIRTVKPGSLTERWLVSYQAQLQEEIDRLGRGLYDAVHDAAAQAATDRVETELVFMDSVARQAEAGLSQRFVDTLSAVPTDTLRAMFDAKMYTDGRSLSQRIWTEEGRLEGNLAEIIQQGIAQQMDPLTLARHLEAYMNPKAACPVSWHTLYPSIPFDRKIDYNALRLARTSIIHAHWIAGKAAAKKNPLCAGMKWNLSNQHYERQVAVAGEDICDEYARHDEGLGRGVFAIDSLPLPHPNCLCYQTEVMPTLEDAADRLAAWDGANDPALNDAFEKWRQENAAELEQLHEKWNRELGGVERLIKRQLDNSGEFGKMDTEQVAAAMIAVPVIPDDKIYKYMLAAEKQHYRDFIEAGYSGAEDGERLRADIIRLCKNAKLENVRYNSELNHARYEQYIQLGTENRRFVVAWKIEAGASAPSLVTCYRKEG